MVFDDMCRPLRFFPCRRIRGVTQKIHRSRVRGRVAPSLLVNHHFVSFCPIKTTICKVPIFEQIQLHEGLRRSPHNTQKLFGQPFVMVQTRYYNLFSRKGIIHQRVDRVVFPMVDRTSTSSSSSSASFASSSETWLGDISAVLRGKGSRGLQEDVPFRLGKVGKICGFPMFDLRQT